jgi:predicted component of type VI protein secretion system
MAALFHLVVRSGPETGKVFPLEASEIVIGREASNGVAINDAEISRKHAKLSLHGTAYVIQDLGSTNGTFVNGQRVTNPRVLNPGDSVSFGENIVLLYEVAVDPNATVISSAPAPRTVTPIYRPIPEPAYTPPVAAPAYSGQVPAGPPPAAPLPAKKFPIWVIIVIAIVVLICACIGFFLIIDQLNLWCKVVPFLVPLLGGACA